MTGEALAQPTIPPEQAFTEFVFKLSSRCNMQPPSSEEDATLLQLPIIAQGGTIGCDQCYEYANNTSWRQQPTAMDMDVVRQAASRIAEHADQNGIEDIRIVGHGGEPLLRSAKYLDEFATVVRNSIETDNRKVHLSVQTNGLLLTDKKLEVLLRHDVTVGLSLDGDKTANDLHRRDMLGRSTYDRAVRAARLLNTHNANWGIITVIDPTNNPEETLEALAVLQPRSIKLHTPHANWSSLPKERQGAITFGEWQVRAFERYRRWAEFHTEQDKPPFSLHLANDYIDAFLGAAPKDERVSNRYPHELFFLPNGDIQRLDTLKVTEAGAYETPFNVFDHSLNEVAHMDPGFIARRAGSTALAEECRSCEFFQQCGGDYYPLRFRQTNEPLGPQSQANHYIEAFRNPSVYCADQKQFLGHIAAFVESQKAAFTTMPVDVTEIWTDVAYCGTQDNDYREGTLANASSFSESSLRNFSALRGAFDKAADVARTSKIFSVGNAIDMPPIPVSLENELRDSVRTGSYTGAGALLALQELSAKDRPDSTIYFQAGSTRHMLEGQFRLAEQYACVKVAGHWLVTKNAVETVARLASIKVPSVSFVSVLQVPPQYSDSLEPGLSLIEAEHYISRQQPYIAPVRVGFRDLPHDLIIVDTPGRPAKDSIKAVYDIAEAMPQFSSHPQKAKTVISPGVELMPIRGEWRLPFQVTPRHLSRGFSYDAAW